MTLILPGHQLEQLCQEAVDEVLLAAPFIKVSVLERLLGKISSNATVKCITRWQPEEIVAGVSDLEVWSVVKDRPKTNIWLKPHLHAKFYRADQYCLVGSANLTAKALGWSTPSNLEILVQMSATDLYIKSFETELLKDCIEVDEGIFQQFHRTVELLTETKSSLPIYTSNIDFIEQSDPLISDEWWLPILRHPEDLYPAYCGKLEKLTATTINSALTDLQSLPVPQNLTQEAFKTYVGTLLLQKPIVQTVDLFVSTPQRFGAVRNLLKTLPCHQISEFDANRSWQTLMRWLLYFLPHRYHLSVPHYSEIFYRVKLKQ